MFPKSDNNRYFNLADEKRIKLFEVIENIPFLDYKVMFYFLIRGRRKGEVLKLEWRDVNFEMKSYVIRDENSKTRDRFELFLDNDLLDALKELKLQSGNNRYVFINQKTKEPFGDIPRRFWKHIKKEAGIDDMKIHDFRHLLGFTLVNNKVPIEAISKQLTHKDIRTTQKYSNMQAQMADKAVQAYLGLGKR